jgi:DNA primase
MTFRTSREIDAPPSSVFAAFEDSARLQMWWGPAGFTNRARRGAPVSAPCTWEEVERGEVSPGSFTIRNMAQRIENVGDLWSDLLKTKRSLRLAIERLSKML